MSEQKYIEKKCDPNYPVMVSVHVCTYNQEKWIAQTLDSILMQQTDYSYEIIIGEDCSTDGTHAVCEEYVRKYPDLIRIAPQDKNMGIVGNWVNCIKLSRGKYSMGCAGDDFWNNVHKIQLQVEYMETHPECVILHTDNDELNSVTGEVRKNRHEDSVTPTGYIQSEILSGRGNINAPTQCLRMDAVRKWLPLDEFVNLRFPREDWPMQLILAAHGTVDYLPISTVTYRIGHPSVSHEVNYEKILDMYQRDKVMTKFLYDMFPEWGEFKDEDYFDNYPYHVMLIAAYKNNDYQKAKEFAAKDKYTSMVTRMAVTWFTFQLWRIIKKFKF